MEPEAKYTIVGTAVLVLVALLASAIVWLKSTEGQRDDVPYKIYFARQSLEGLQIRSDVKMQGIRVGSVTGFRISPRRRGSVEVTIRVDGSTPVLESTRATVERHLLTGIASILLTNTNDDAPRLTEAPPNEPHPVIAEGESEYKLSESAAHMAQRADETMRRINRLLSDENQAALSAILVNVKTISANVDRTLSGLDRTMAGLDRAVAAVGGAAEEVRKTSAAIATDAQRLAARYDALGETSTVAVRDVSAAIRGMGTDVARLSNRMDALLADSNVELRLTARELRATADALSNAARQFSNPGRALFGPGKGTLGPGEAGQ